MQEFRLTSRLRDLGGSPLQRRAPDAQRCTCPKAAASNGSNGAGTHVVPPAWPGRAVIDPNFKPSSSAKKFSLLGSTGSIGTQTLDIAREHKDKFEIVAIAAGRNIELLAEQVREFQPSLVSIQDGSQVEPLRELLKDVPRQPEISVGDAGILEVASHPDAQAVVTGIVGCAGLAPTCAAISSGKDICLANKETLIAGAPYVLPLATKHNVNILPADSEHSAIFQCIQGLPEGGLRRIILTASGGAFREWPVEKLKTVKVADAIKHPNWSMGKKITVDSASLMNKGLEVIEAHYLFGPSYDDIEIIIHPQSIIHSMVETSDSSIIGQRLNDYQEIGSIVGLDNTACYLSSENCMSDVFPAADELGWPDMKLPILVTMAWPERTYCSEQTWPRLDFIKMGDLTFKEVDRAKYPAVDLAYAAGRTGGTMTGVLSAANEKAVELFLAEKIGYLDVMRLVEKTCDEHKKELVLAPSLDEIVHFDGWAREFVDQNAALVAA